MWWSFDQWVIIIGLVTALVSAVVPVTVELIRRVRVRNEPIPPDQEVVEIDERFIDHLVSQIKFKDRDIREYKRTIERLSAEKEQLHHERDAAYYKLATLGVPFPEEGKRKRDNPVY